MYNTYTPISSNTVYISLIRHYKHLLVVVYKSLLRTYQEGNGSVRFVSLPDFSKINRFGSFRFGNVFCPVRRGLACVFRTRHGSVRFGSVRFRVRFRPVPESNGSVRFGSAGSVRFLIPSWHVTAVLGYDMTCSVLPCMTCDIAVSESISCCRTTEMSKPWGWSRYPSSTPKFKVEALRKLVRRYSSIKAKGILAHVLINIETGGAGANSSSLCLGAWGFDLFVLP